mgnify:CR=1 FL=1
MVSTLVSVAALAGPSMYPIKILINQSVLILRPNLNLPLQDWLICQSTNFGWLIHAWTHCGTFKVKVGFARLVQDRVPLWSHFIEHSSFFRLIHHIDRVFLHFNARQTILVHKIWLVPCVNPSEVVHRVSVIDDICRYSHRICNLLLLLSLLILLNHALGVCFLLNFGEHSFKSGEFRVEHGCCRILGWVLWEKFNWLLHVGKMLLHGHVELEKQFFSILHSQALLV